MRKIQTLAIIATLAATLTPDMFTPSGEGVAQARYSGLGYRYEEHSNFKKFYDDFRKAVLLDDRQAVTRMVQFPFIDYQHGNTACTVGSATCPASSDARTSDNAEEFLAHYDQIFTPAVRSALEQNRLRAHSRKEDDGEAPGPIRKGEHLLNPEDWNAQLVFSKRGGRYKLTRIPFYS